MSLNRGRPLTSIPGPSVIPDQVLSAMHTAMPNIYEGALVDMSASLFEDLPKVVDTEGQVFVAISNGHGAWEMSLTNILSRGETVLALECGRFATGWAEMARKLGCEAEIMHAPERAAVDPAAVEERLRADREHKIKAVLVVQVDTASSVWNDIQAIRRAMDAAGHPALLMVDGIASLGCVPYHMDAWGVDVTVGGAQKGLMVPPGLGLVWASEKALAAHKQADLSTAYWDWTARMSEGAHYLRYCGTAPIQHIYAMRTALDMLFDEGLDAVWARHRVFAEAVRSAVEAWSCPEGLSFNVLDPAQRSDSTTTVLAGVIDPEELRRLCEHEAGLTLGVGLGDFDGRAFRIGHMGHLNPPMVLGTLATIEAALIAMEAPLGGSGTVAASQVIAKALAPKVHHALSTETAAAG